MSAKEVIQADMARRQRRFDILDFYRFAGALGVVLVHYMLIYFPIPQEAAVQAFLRVQPLIGFFFALSGFVIMHMYDGRMNTGAEYVEFMRKRLARMYPLFLATFLIACLWGLCTTTRPGMFAASAVLPNLLMVHAWNTTSQLTFDYPSWTVSAEMFVYLLFPIFLGLLDRLKGFGPILPFVLALVVEAIFARFDLGDWRAATFNAGCLRAAPPFVGGMVVYRLATGPLAGWRCPVWAAHLMGIASVPLMLAGVDGYVMLIYSVALVLALAAAEPAQPGVLSRPWARALTNASYGVYLLHGLVAPVLLGAFVRFMGWPRVATYALAPFAVAVTVALALASFRYFEDPARRYLSKLGSRRSGSGAGSRRAPVAG